MREHSINVLTFGEPEPGIWCDKCSLPSAFRLHLVGQEGMNVLDLGSRNYCPECDTVSDIDKSVRTKIYDYWTLSDHFVSDYAQIVEDEDREIYFVPTIEEAETTEVVTESKQDLPWAEKPLGEKIAVMFFIVLLTLIAAFILAELTIFGWSIVVHTWRSLKP